MKIIKLNIITREKSLPTAYLQLFQILIYHYMKHVFLTALTLAFTFALSAQLTKNNWLVGGTGNFLASKQSYSSQTYSSSSDEFQIDLAANIGYFIVDKVALGLKPGYSKFKAQGNGPGGGYSNENRFYIGPFARYYFLKTDKEFNLLTDVSYQHGFYWFKPIRGNINIFSASAGPVVYFNSSVGLEFLLGYYSKKEIIKQSSDYVNKRTGFQISIGFQIHLEK